MATTLVFNATGAQGTTIYRRLLQQGHTVIAPVRSTKSKALLESNKVAGFISDFSTTSLLPIVKKADQIVLQIPAAIAPSEMITIGENAMEAIRLAGNPATVFVISSTIATDYTGVASVDARRRLVELAQEKMPNTPILSSTEYLENFSTAYREAIMQNGIIPQAIPGDLPVNYLSWGDLATYVTAALETDSLEGKIYPMGGNEGITGIDLARRLGHILGKSLNYVTISFDQLKGILTPIMGAERAKDYAEFYEWEVSHGATKLNPDTGELQQLLGIQLASFEEWAKNAFL